jgi:hypothetical protein
MENHQNIAGTPRTPPFPARWSADDIPYGLVDTSRVTDDIYLFYLVAAASLVEVNSDLYARNLAEYFRDDAEISDWLARHWQHEEINHGIALRRYVNTAWPAFDWDRARRRFDSEYGRLCRPERLGPTRALELAARCVVETGTASLYTMLSRLSTEPVLAGLSARIRADEVRHYRYFYHFFLEYRRRESPGLYAVARTLWRRVKEVENEDGFYAFKHVYLERHPARRFDESVYLKLRRHYLQLAQRHYPYGMAVRMFAKPLRLDRRLQRLALPLLAAGARRIHG